MIICKLEGTFELYGTVYVTAQTPWYTTLNLTFELCASSMAATEKSVLGYFEEIIYLL